MLWNMLKILYISYLEGEKLIIFVSINSVSKAAFFASKKLTIFEDQQ